MTPVVKNVRLSAEDLQESLASAAVHLHESTLRKNKQDRKHTAVQTQHCCSSLVRQISPDLLEEHSVD